MDSLTHLAIGTIVPLAFRSTPRRAAAIFLGIAGSQLPDIDIIAGSSATAMLAVHRGMTHSFLAVAVFSLVLAWIFRLYLKRRERNDEVVRVEGGIARLAKPVIWNFSALWGVAALCLLLHLYLDSMTTYGTRVFWPFSELRVGFPALYIVDPLYTLPLVWIMLRNFVGLSKVKKNGAQLSRSRKALVWIILYPLVCLGIHHFATAQRNAEPYPGQPENSRIELTTMPLSPFLWKTVEVSPGTYRMGVSSLLDVWLGKSPEFSGTYQRPDAALSAAVFGSLPLFQMVRNFTSFPSLVVETPPLNSVPPFIRGDANSLRLLSFRDLRYLPAGPADLTIKLGLTDGMFILQVLEDENGRMLAWRFLTRGRDARGTPWERHIQ